VEDQTVLRVMRKVRRSCGGGGCGAAGIDMGKQRSQR